jgi:hypothetical protein
LKDLVGPWPVLRGQPVPVLQAPYFHQPPWRGERPFLAASYADILAVRGFDAVEHLLPLAQAWQRLIEQVRPALLIGDYSPTLCLAAYQTLPVLTLGNGFIMPPVEGTTFPSLVPGQAPVLPEDRVLAVVREVQRRRQRPAPDTLPGLLAAAERFVTVLPELDPYQAARREPLLGPLDPPLPAPLPRPERPGFFAYLSAEAPEAEAVLVGLAGAGLPGRAYLRGAAPEQRERLRRHGLAVADTPPALDEAFRAAAVVVHHASAGTAQVALAAGRPQLLFPQHLEHILYAQLLQRLGVAQYLLGRFDAADVAQALHQLATDPGFTERAQETAQGVFARGPWDPLPRIVERCLALLNRAT